MSTATATAEPTYADRTEDAYEYRAIYTGAILGLLIAVLSVVFPLTVSSFTDVRQAAVLGVAPLVGLVVSALSLRKIRANRDLYTGDAAAMAGTILAATSLFGGTAFGAYVYVTEVPEGYQRTSFLDMKPDDVELAAQKLVPPKVESLLGEKVFIKGYIRPDSTNNGLRRGITEFLLVRDNNQCCFGDVSKVMYYDQVAVKLDRGMSTDYSQGVFRVGGELAIRPGNSARGEPPLVYSLQADHIK